MSNLIKDQWITSHLPSNFTILTWANNRAVVLVKINPISLQMSRIPRLVIVTKLLVIVQCLVLQTQHQVTFLLLLRIALIQRSHCLISNQRVWNLSRNLLVASQVPKKTQILEVHSPWVHLEVLMKSSFTYQAIGKDQSLKLLTKS